MSKKPLYIELLSFIDVNRQGEEWVDLASPFRQKLADPEFFRLFKEEIEFLSGHNDILARGNLAENPDADSIQLSAQITDIGQEYLRSYKFVKEEDQDRFSTKQIMLLMFGIIAGTVLLACALAYFSDKI